MTVTYLENTNQIVDNVPVITIKLISSQFQTLVSSDLVDCFPIRMYKLHHVIGQIPPGHDIARNESRLKIELAADAAPSRKSDCGRIDDGK